jgi:carboxymethylenebutenolidase
VQAAWKDVAVRAVRADTVITTGTEGLVAGEVRVPVADGEIPAYRARPAKGQAFPVVLVVQEIFGVHEHIKDVCRRFASEGYCAIAPELYARQGDVSQMTDCAVQQEVIVVTSHSPFSASFSSVRLGLGKRRRAEILVALTNPTEYAKYA